MAIDGGAKTRTTAWPAVGKRFGEEELQELREALEQNTLFYMHGGKTKAFCAKLGANAKALGEAMRAEGIPCGAGYVAPVYLQYEFFRTQAAFNHSTWPFSHYPVPPYGPGYCPNAERVATECLNFPLNQWLSEQEIDDTLTAAVKVAAAFRKRAGR